MAVQSTEACQDALYIFTVAHLFLLCFFNNRPQLRFEKIKGVARCVVGYTGGKEANPTYRSMKDHSEAMLVEFDPSRVAYEELVIAWTQMHTPNYQRTCQYKSAIWYLDQQEQHEIAVEIVRGWKLAAKEPLFTSIAPAGNFYQAETYHQHFLTKRGGGNTRWA